MNSFISRVKKIQDADKGKILFVERSVYTDKHCFAENCYESGMMNKIEYDIYNRWHEWLTNNFTVKPDAYIYLRTEYHVVVDCRPDDFELVKMHCALDNLDERLLRTPPGAH